MSNIYLAFTTKHKFPIDRLTDRNSVFDFLHDLYKMSSDTVREMVRDDFYISSMYLSKNSTDAKEASLTIEYVTEGDYRRRGAAHVNLCSEEEFLLAKGKYTEIFEPAIHKIYSLIDKLRDGKFLTDDICYMSDRHEL